MSRDQIDLDAIFEQHSEQFECFCNDNLDFSNDLIETFGTPLEQWQVWKTDCVATRFEVESTGFEALYDFDAESCASAPIRCLKSYKSYQLQKDLIAKGFHNAAQAEHMKNCNGCAYCD